MCCKINSHRLSLAESKKLFTNAIESIEDLMDLSDNGSGERLDEANKMCENALKMFENQSIGKLAKIIFTDDDPLLEDIVRNLRKAYDGFIEYWRDNDQIEFETRFDALQSAFFCDVYRTLLIHKNLKKFNIEDYFTLILPELTKYYGKMRSFVILMLRFDNRQPDIIVQNLFAQSECKTAKLDNEDIVKWLTDVRESSMQQLLTITSNSMIMAATIIKEIYRNRFQNCNSFYFDSKSQFDTNSWIPITLIVKGDDNVDETKPFELIENGLQKKGIVVITGEPGAGKTSLMRKIAFEYGQSTSELCDWRHFVHEYDIVLFTNFRSTADQKTKENLFELALYGLEKLTIDGKSISNFIRKNRYNCKLLIMLDGYDEANIEQRRLVDKFLMSNTSYENLLFHFILTSRPLKTFRRSESVVFLESVGFDKEQKQKEYIETHRSIDENINVESIMTKIKSNSAYRQMAEKPLLLTFICLVYKELENGTRIELYEKFVSWFIRHKSSDYKNVCEALRSKEEISLELGEPINVRNIERLTRRWWKMEQMKRLGCISLHHLANGKIQFNEDENAIVINTTVINQIGLIIEVIESIGYEIDVYRFAHQSLQEYFAAMFMAKWEDKCKYPQVEESLMQGEKIDQMSMFFTEILLKERKVELANSSKKYLKNAKLIHFDIIPDYLGKSLQEQFNYINSHILHECQNLIRIEIDMHQMKIKEAIVFNNLASMKHVTLTVKNAIFEKDDYNMISISKSNMIDIEFVDCQYALSRIIKFAEYIENNENATCFERIQFDVKSNTIADVENIRNLDNIIYRRYTGALCISSGEWMPYVKELLSNTNIAIFKMIQLYSGIKSLEITIPEPEQDDSNLIQYQSNFENLSILTLDVLNKNTSVGNIYWNSVNKIIEKCPIIDRVSIRLNKNVIDKPIDLRFRPVDINVEICNGIFDDNTLNIVCIGDAKAECIKFDRCRFGLSRLLAFAEFIDKDEEKFGNISFDNLNKEDEVTRRDNSPNPMSLAEAIIKEIYRNRFEQSKSTFRFDRNTLIPIKLVKSRSDSNTQSEEPFELIYNVLAENGVVIITGKIGFGHVRFKPDSGIPIPITDFRYRCKCSTFIRVPNENRKNERILGEAGSGKTLLTQKIAFDYSTNSRQNKWNKYDIVLLTEFCTNSDKDKRHKEILEMALYGLEKIGLKTNLTDFIKRHAKKCKRMLIILDGYDKAVADQCRQLDKILSSNGSEMKLDYDLIITTKPSKIINRKTKITIVDIVRPESSFISTFGKMAINRLIQLNPKDLKMKALTIADVALRQNRERSLKISLDSFINVIDLINNQISYNRSEEKEPGKLFENMLKMLENEEITMLANVVFYSDDRRLDIITNDLNSAHNGFIEFWLAKDYFHFDERFSALQLAFFCNIYLLLFMYKNLQKLKIEEYLSFILSGLIECIREKKAQYYSELRHFVTVLLRFTDQPINQIVQKAFVNYRHELKSASDEKEDIEKIVVNWLIDVQTEDPLLQQPLIIICKPMALAESIIKELYRNQFGEYNLFYIDLGFQFDMNSWFPIKLVKVKGSDDEHKLFDELICEELSKSGLVVITGASGAGKTLLTHKIVFDYATLKSKENKWNKYDLILLAEFSSTSDCKHETIIDMALNGIEKSGVNNNVCNFIRENVNTCKRILIILDGYDESVKDQCRQLKEVLGSYGNKIKFEFDLIVTRRPSTEIDRKENITYLDIKGFDTKETRKAYIERHFVNIENKDEKIKSVISKIEENESYKEMATTPLMLTFICLLDSLLKKGTRVELYENVICWFIGRKLNTNPHLLAELASNESVFVDTSKQIENEKAENITKNWFDLEQMQRLGYISLLYLEKKQYQFDDKELQSIQPNININVFIKIGLIISNTEGSIVNRTTNYQFAHKILQEYFAAMFMVIWKDEYYRRFPLLANIQNINPGDELLKFIIEMLLAKRDSKYIQSVEQYLRKTKRISFEIHSNDIDESWKQINYISDILQKCSNIESVQIDLHKISVNNTIELHLLPNIDKIQVEISNGLFSNNQSNIISISGPNKIQINIRECDLSISGLILFAEYINNNAQRFNWIRLNYISLTEADMININKLKSIYFKQYCGYLSINNLQLDSTQSTEYINTYIINLSILQLFFGIKELELRLPRNDEMNDNSYLLQQSIEYPSNMTNLTELILYYNDDTTSIGKTYWTCINIILQKCPSIRNIWVKSLSHNISIDEPIDLQFLSLKHDIKLDIWKVKFTDNDSNMICINGEVQQINIRFINCKYSYRRLIAFANYINQNSQLFNKIEFTNVSDNDIFDAVLMNTKFDHIVIKQDERDKYSIVKR